MPQLTAVTDTYMHTCTPLQGSDAEWHDLNWTLLRLRNVADRADLIIVVGSEDVVIGRYVFSAIDFENIPQVRWWLALTHL